MTNGEKYKTAQEREAAYNEYCNKNHCVKGCSGCQLADNRICSMYWLELEAEEKPLPCPFCGGFLIPFDLSGFSFVCDCGYHTKVCKTREEAIAAHNRVAKKCLEVR